MAVAESTTSLVSPCVPTHSSTLSTTPSRSKAATTPGKPPRLFKSLHAALTTSLRSEYWPRMMMSPPKAVCCCCGAPGASPLRPLGDPGPSPLLFSDRCSTPRDAWDRSPLLPPAPVDSLETSLPPRPPQLASVLLEPSAAPSSSPAWLGLSQSWASILAEDGDEGLVTVKRM